MEIKLEIEDTRGLTKDDRETVEIKNAEWYLLSWFKTIFDAKILLSCFKTTYILSKHVSNASVIIFLVLL